MAVKVQPKLKAPPREEIVAEYERLGSVPRVAAHFGVGRQTMLRFMQEYGIERNGKGHGACRLHTVPVDVVKKLLEQIIAENPLLRRAEFDGRPEVYWRNEQPAEVGWGYWCEEMGPLIGVSPRRLQSILRREQERFSFDTVDKILTYFGMSMFWYHPDLIDHYYTPEEVRPSQDTILTIQRFWGYV